MESYKQGFLFVELHKTKNQTLQNLQTNIYETATDHNSEFN